MSLGNDPRKVSREEPEPKECRYCDGRTYDPKRVCPDCRYEGAGL